MPSRKAHLPASSYWQTCWSWSPPRGYWSVPAPLHEQTRFFGFRLAFIDKNVCHAWHFSCQAWQSCGFPGVGFFFCTRTKISCPIGVTGDNFMFPWTTPKQEELIGVFISIFFEESSCNDTSQSPIMWSVFLRTDGGWTCDLWRGKNIQHFSVMWLVKLVPAKTGSSTTLMSYKNSFKRHSTWFV